MISTCKAAEREVSFPTFSNLPFPRHAPVPRRTSGRSLKTKARASLRLPRPPGYTLARARARALSLSLSLSLASELDRGRLLEVGSASTRWDFVSLHSAFPVPTLSLVSRILMIESGVSRVVIASFRRSFRLANCSAGFFCLRETRRFPRSVVVGLETQTQEGVLLESNEVVIVLSTAIKFGTEPRTVR